MITQFSITSVIQFQWRKDINLFIILDLIVLVDLGQ